MPAAAKKCEFGILLRTIAGGDKIAGINMKWEMHASDNDFIASISSYII